MKLVKATIAAALFGLSMSAFAAVTDLNYVTHGMKEGQEQKIGQIIEPRWSDRTVANPDARKEVKPFAKSAGNYRFSDLTSVTHN